LKTKNAGIAAITAIAGYVIDKLRYNTEDINVFFVAPYSAMELPFSYNKNILIPQIAFVALIYICYL
jgi:hypothetical protein